MKTFGQFLESTTYDSDRADSSLGAIGQIWNIFHGRDEVHGGFTKIMSLLDLHGDELRGPLPSAFHPSWKVGGGSSLDTIMALATRFWYGDLLLDREKAELIGKLLDMGSEYPVTPKERDNFQKAIKKVEPVVRNSDPKLAEKLVAAALASELES